MANTTGYKRTEAEQDFVDWLDSVAEPVDTSKPLVDKGRDYAREKHDKKEGYRHRWLMANNFWYRQDYIHSKRMEEERLIAESEGREYIEPEAKQLGEDGFWEQF